uniref:Uncharacterized protein n=1 Tax=Brassica oleracea TaxID=3712 RepID=A0A3P6CVY9_BRAOL|nr:unnamed protein product [Brassica oleracea]
MVIGSFMDLHIIEPIFCFLSPKGKVKNVNSILEPVMIHQPASSFYEAQTGRSYLGSGRTTKTSRNHHKGLCTKNGQTYMGCIRRHGKGCFYVSNRSPSSWNC